MTHARDSKHAAEETLGEATEVPAARPAADDQPRPGPPKRTRLGGTWVAVVVALVVLTFLLIFILQNLENATVHFLGAVGSMPLAVAMLLAAVAGGALVALVGAARILQLRAQNRKSRKSV
ncbi:lipopolysaccharide assembly protein LapA domain-containing protein [Amycolatopsis minnesotensis]